MRLGGALTAIAVGVMTLMPGAGAQEPPGLIVDSLAALGGLVDADSCAVADAADGDAAELALPYVFCDDGLPPAGGGEGAVPVPAAYHPTAPGQDWKGLPQPATAEEVAAADADDDLQPEAEDRISLDVDVTLPPSPQAAALLGDAATFTPMARPKGGWPVIVLMHGCCGGNKTSWEAATIDAEGERWHHSNAWFASRGYVVVTYTARGFRNSDDQGSTGTTQLDSRRYEINDYQYLVGLLADHDAERRAVGEKPVFGINPRRIGVVGGSYGGGFAWLALTDPSWNSPAHDVALRAKAVVAKYGWTDLVEALVPAGHYFDRDPVTNKTWIAPTDPAKAMSRAPLGVLKQSVVTGLYATGNNFSGDHTTFPEWMDAAFNRLQQSEPEDGDETLEEAANTFLADRSAYYQQRFWKRVAKGLRVPLFSAATWTDPLFPTMEHMRFYNRLRKVAPTYPVTTYLGDYQHFAQNKPKEWGDLCGEDHHVCTVADHTNAEGELNLAKVPSRVRKGVNTRMNAFLAYHLKGAGRRPASNVSATTTICPANATEELPVDEPGVEFRAGSWRGLTDGAKTIGWSGGGMSTTAAPDLHAQEADPVARQGMGEFCVTHGSPDPGLGVIVYESNELAEPITLLGIPTLTLEFETSASGYWIAARLYDQDPGGARTLVTRGVCRFDADFPDRKCDVFDLWGNAWTFAKGHRVVVEVSQADSPFLRRHDEPSTIQFLSANVRLPTADPKRNVDFR
jgi:predicted acyl esterase